MDCSTPGFPVHRQLPELAQTHAHQVGDAIQPSYPLPSPSPPAFSLLQHQGLFQRVSSYLFEGNPVDEGTTRRDTDIPMHRLEKPADSTHSSKCGSFHLGQ